MKQVFSVLQLAVLILLTIGTVSAQAGAVQHWTFDTSLAEENGGVTGTAINDAIVQGTAGVVGGAVYFDGTDDAVSISKSVVPIGTVSFSFWAKADGETVGYMLCDGVDATNFLTRRYDDGTPSFNGWAGDANIFKDITPFNTDTWYHNVIVSDAAAGETLWYVNGVLNEPVIPATSDPNGVYTIGSFTGDLLLGNRTDLGRDFKGWIDDLQIYDYALMSTDVGNLYANPGQVVSAVPEPGTIALLLAGFAGLLLVRRR